MLVPLKTVLNKAHKEGYAVGAFNVNNLEFIQAVIEAAEIEKSPVIISTSEGAIHYAGMEELGALVHIAAKKAKVPVVFHLDHGKDEKLIEKAIKSGLYTSVMYDGSSHTLRENIKRTKRLVKMAHEHHVSVEAELGAIAGIEDFVSVEQKDAHLTNPADAVEFVKETGCDALAVAVGTSHGAYKFKKNSRLDYKRLQEIKDLTKMPLVLHGASGVPEYLKKLCMRYGCKIEDAKGVSNATIKKAIEHGINKINIDTDLRIAFDAAVRSYMYQNPENLDPRKVLTRAKELITTVVRRKMILFGSSGKGK